MKKTLLLIALLLAGQAAQAQTAHSRGVDIGGGHNESGTIGGAAGGASIGTNGDIGTDGNVTAEGVLTMGSGSTVVTNADGTVKGAAIESAIAGTGLTYSAGVINRDAIDVSDDTNLAAGDGLTLTGDSMAVDSTVARTDAAEVFDSTLETVGALTISGNSQKLNLDDGTNTSFIRQISGFLEFESSHATNGAAFNVNGSQKFVVTASNIRPSTDAGIALGANTIRFSTGYFDALENTGNINADAITLGDGSVGVTSNNASIIIDDAHGGAISIDVENGSNRSIWFADQDEADAGQIQYQEATKRFALGTKVAGGNFEFRSGDNAVALTLDENQNALFEGNVTVDGALDTLSDLTIGDGTGVRFLYIDGANTSNRGIEFLAGGTKRWRHVANATSNDYKFRRFDATGTPVDDPISISASTGQVSIEQNLVVTNGRLIVSTQETPASASAAGVKGTIAHDSNYIYICVATNTWKRVAISTW